MNAFRTAMTQFLIVPTHQKFVIKQEIVVRELVVLVIETMPDRIQIFVGR